MATNENPRTDFHEAVAISIDTLLLRSNPSALTFDHAREVGTRCNSARTYRMITRACLRSVAINKDCAAFAWGQVTAIIMSRREDCDQSCEDE